MNEKSKHVFINRHGDVKIDASEFRAVRDFSDGIAAVLTNEDRWGFIDTTGNLRIAPEYYEVGDFSDGLAVVKTEEENLEEQERWGYIDRTGNQVFEGKFDTAYDFSEGIALAETRDSVFTISKEGRVSVLFERGPLNLALVNGNSRFSNGLVTVWNEETKKYGYVNQKGELVIQAKFANAAGFSEGLARVSIIQNNRELMGVVDTKGDFVIPPKFDIDFDFTRNATDFSEGLASVIDGPPTIEGNPRFIYIDKQGNVVLETPFFSAEQFKEGLAVVYDEKLDRYGFIGKSGELVISPHYITAGNFSDGLARVEILKRAHDW